MSFTKERFKLADPVATIETITPEVAAKMLEGNVNNRVVRQRTVERYANDMRRGHWPLNGSAIVMNGKSVHDGQHRLLACILSGCSFKTIVMRGVPDRANHTIDVGMARTISDELRWRGEKDTASLGATLSLLWAYDGEHFSNNYRPSRAELLAILRTNPGLRDSLAATHATAKKAPGLNRTALATTHFLLTREHGREVADSFVEDVLAGEGYDEHDPCLTLRNYAAAARGHRTRRVTTLEWLAVTNKTANFWLVGQPVQTLRWRRVGKSRESFPRITPRDEV